MSNILIVDDELEVVKVLEEFFSMKGFGTITAFNGIEAMDVIKSGAEVDLIILDIKMPIMKGIDFLVESKIIKEEKMPVIILSGSVNAKRHYSILRSLGYDPNHIIYKPIDLNVLFEMVRKKLEGIGRMGPQDPCSSQ